MTMTPNKQYLATHSRANMELVHVHEEEVQESGPTMKPSYTNNSRVAPAAAILAFIRGNQRAYKNMCCTLHGSDCNSCHFATKNIKKESLYGRALRLKTTRQDLDFAFGT
eukprot:1765388-Amphidinium_carterae.1